MVSRLGTQYEAKVQLFELMRAVRGKPVLYHYQFQKRMLPPHIAQQSCRRVAFAIVFLLSILLSNWVSVRSWGDGLFIEEPPPVPAQGFQRP